MRSKKTLTLILIAFLIFSKTSAQINLGERALGALQNGMAAFTFSDEDAAKLSKEAVRKLDSTNVVAGPKDGYTLRLNRVFGKHIAENGLKLNYKVYLTKDVNAFATADGSVRVFSGLMDIMDDNELLAVIGHEIGHVANHDSRDAMKAAYRKAALIDAAASQSDKIAKLTDGQLGQIGSAIIDSKFSRKQESEADTFSYEFMKRNGYNVNAVASAFSILAKMSEGTQSNFLTQMVSSHPEPKNRAEIAKGRAQADGLYKPYVAKPINNKATTTKVPAKKATKKK
ncbi:M48 family metalloprotease [Flavobacterium sp.]|jgi:putative metalloprotease|uniref:M48 family metalloprotease n=1 Tax=Flavobacterium sp. TaxID=239 RepID=UPI0037C10DD0